MNFLIKHVQNAPYCKERKMEKPGFYGKFHRNNARDENEHLPYLACFIIQIKCFTFSVKQEKNYLLLIIVTDNQLITYKISLFLCVSDETVPR